MPTHELTPPRDSPDADPDVDRRVDTTRWSQLHIEFRDWSNAAALVHHRLRPALDQTPAWWFIRKHPHWRVRYLDHHSKGPVHRALGELAAHGLIVAWHPTRYEPEELAFGGDQAMEIAHDLFASDSPVALDLLVTPDRDDRPGRRELSMLAVSRLARGAGLDWFEQGDLWDQVATLRRAGALPPRATATASAPVRRGETVDAAMHRLLTLDTGPATDLLRRGSLAPWASWLAAHDHAGARLGELARTGRLRRGLRVVLAQHVLFHWNRLALNQHEQFTLAARARDVLLPPGHDS